SGWSAGGIYTVQELANGGFEASSAVGALFTPWPICWANAWVVVSTESFDYGDALGHTSTNQLTFWNEQFQTSLNGPWLTLPSLCNKRYAFDQNGVPFSLEGIFQCNVVGSSINLYTAR